MTGCTLELHDTLPASARLDDYFGAWAMLEDRFRSACDALRSMDLARHVREFDGARRGPEVSTIAAAEAGGGGGRSAQSAGKIAIVAITGTLMKAPSSTDDSSTSLVWARRTVRALADNPSIDAIMLRIDSPGGTAAGTQDLAHEVAEAAKRKPVHAYIEDLGASAAYWIASQATKVWSNPTAIVGSIGTFMVVHDLSEMAQKEGVKVHVVRAGELKGAGTPGTPITDEQLAKWQAIVDSLNTHFLAAVGRGRGLSDERVRELATGQVWVGGAAVTAGLTDGIRTWDAALDELARASRQTPDDSGPRRPAQETHMSNQTEGAAVAQERRAATIADLKGAFPKAGAEFRESCLERGLTMAEATTEYARLLETQQAEQAAQLAAAQKELAEARRTPAAARLPGVDPALGRDRNGTGGAGAGRADTGADEGGDPVEAFDAAVRKQTAAGVSRSTAIANVAERHPDLHRNYLLATNGGRRQRTLIADKFGE